MATTPSTLGARPRPQIDDPIGRLDHFQIVLDNEHGTAGIHQAAQDMKEFLYVLA